MYNYIQKTRNITNSIANKIYITNITIYILLYL